MTTALHEKHRAERLKREGAERTWHERYLPMLRRVQSVKHEALTFSIPSPCLMCGQPLTESKQGAPMCFACRQPVGN